MTRRFDDITVCEHRPERSYDYGDASHLRHPNGTLVASFDAGFVNAAGREVIDLWVAEMERQSA